MQYIFLCRPHRSDYEDEDDRQEHPDASMEINEDDDEETKMMKMMGFGGFETTKNKHVPGTDVSGANVKKPLKYRQYMNRRGGFNRQVYSAFLEPVKIRKKLTAII